jgi:spermidine synthase
LAVSAGSIGALAWATGGSAKPSESVLYERETPYNFVQVRRDESGWTQLLIGEGASQQSLLPADGTRTDGVWDALSAVPLLVASDCTDLRVLMLGFGAGTVAAQIEERCRAAPGLQIDGVELDPALLDVGRRYFALRRLERTRTYVGDARVVLRRLPGPYDVILLDAFRGPYVPFHLLTQEFFAECLAKLALGGVVAVNVASGSYGESRLLEAITSTLRTSFTHVWHKEISARSSIFSSHVFIAGRRGPWSERLRSEPPDASLTGAERVDGTPAAGHVLTDDRSPVELHTDRWILGGLLR